MVVRNRLGVWWVDFVLVVVWVFFFGLSESLE